MLTKNLKTKLFALGLMILLLAGNAVRALDQQRIKFAKGENSASVAGSVVPGETDNYLVGGREGQKILVKISSDEKTAFFQVRDAASGKFLSGASEADNATEWNDTIPTTGDYEIIVGGKRGSADYKLSVAVK